MLGIFSKGEHMKQKPGWVLPNLKEAQKRTTNTIDRIDTFTIPEAARMMGRGKNILFQHMVVKPMSVIAKHWLEF